uniref:Uncharacterized protein n=1 Tax=Oncorhynchus mykiss TaxID=8022 RepID=A0A8C7RA16_ONCMY
MKTPFGKRPGQRPRADGGETHSRLVYMKAAGTKPIAQPRRNIVGCRITHQWKEDSKVSQWKGTDPVLYMYQLLDDYKEGDLRIMPDSNDSPPAEREPGEVVDSLVGKQVEYAKEDGGKRTGMVIHQVEAKPSVYFIKFDDDFHIYVYDLVKTS